MTISRRGAVLIDGRRTRELLNNLEQAVLARDPLLVAELQPGVPRNRITGILRESSVTGEMAALVDLYAWKNGISRDSKRTLQENSLFPESIYQFLPLHEAIEHFIGVQRAAKFLVEVTGDPTKISQGSRRYFPVFWDCATGYLAIDIVPSHHNRLVIVDLESEDAIRSAYRRFDDFVIDAIVANQEIHGLRCFRY